MLSVEAAKLQTFVGSIHELLNFDHIFVYGTPLGYCFYMVII